MRFRRFAPALSLAALAACATHADRDTPDPTGTSTQALQSEQNDRAGARRHHRHHCERGEREKERELDVDRVLLLSIDGLHQRDLERFIASHPHSNLAGLARHGVRYTNAWVNTLDGTPTNPSDSFPGLLALTTGGSSPTHGGWYDVSWTRELYAEGCRGAPGSLALYDEHVEADPTLSSLWASATDNHPTHDPVVVRTRLDASKLPHKKDGASCTPVYPHQFIRVNTIFEVAHAAGLHTAWSDKHPTYELVTGPSGTGLDDFFAPEINSSATALIPGAVGDFTSNAKYTEVYDDLKARAILNEIDGRWSDNGLAGATDGDGHPGVPSLFGMNFQAVSVSQKDAKVGPGGYTDASGTPSAELAEAMEHTDDSIGKMVDGLKDAGLFSSTMIIVTAKHGQSPIDHALLQREDGDAIAAHIDSSAPIAGFAADSGNGHIEDDVGLYWLANPATAGAAASSLAAPFATPTGTVDPHAQTVFTVASPGFVSMFGDPATDPHTPDVIVKVDKGTMYSLSKKKWAEHGGFADDDSNVALLVSHPRLEGETNGTKVRTKQVAPTILRALELNPESLDAVRVEKTAVLPDLELEPEDEVECPRTGDAGVDSGAPGPTVVPPYSLSVWAPAPAGATGLDAIEPDGTHLWAAYQNKTTKDGSDGGPGFVANSTLIEYTLSGALPLRSYALAGHVDGLRVDPATHHVWVTSNEDGNPRLFVIDPRTEISTEISLPPTPQGGGLDDLGFFNGKMFAVASAPRNNPNTDPALVQIVVAGTSATFVPALLGNESATDYVTGAPVTLNLQDPDSISFTTDGQLALSSQDDQQLVFVKNPGDPSHSVRLLNVADKIDDTVWATSKHGHLLVADGSSNVIYSIKKAGGFTVNDVYAEVDHHAVIAPLVGVLDLSSGAIAKIASGPGLQNPTGLLFVAGH